MWAFAGETGLRVQDCPQVLSFWQSSGTESNSTMDNDSEKCYANLTVTAFGCDLET